MHGYTIAARRHPCRDAVRRPGRSADGIGLATFLNVRGVLVPALLLASLLSARGLGAAPLVLVGTGDPSPLGLPFSRFSDVALDDHGRVAFVGASSVIFHRVGDQLVRIIGAGDTLQGSTLAGVGAPAVGGGGCLAFQALFVGGASSVLRACGADVEPVAIVGAPTGGGGVFAGFGPVVAIGVNRQIAFTALLDDHTTGLFLAPPSGPISEVTRTGVSSPPGGTFRSLQPVGVTDTGHVGFRATVASGPSGLFEWNGLQVRKLVVANDASPVGGQFSAVGAGSLNDNEMWTFRATVSNRGSSSAGSVGGVFRADSSGPVTLMGAVRLEGDSAPGGGTFRQIPTSLEPTINRAGTIAFRSTLAAASASAGVFTATSDGRLTKVVGVGEETGIGELRQLRDVVVADDGSVLLRANLAGGTPGLFVADGQGVRALALFGELTDLGNGFRFTDPSVRTASDAGVFLGLREGLYVTGARGLVQPVAALGDPTPLGGTYAGFDPPVAGAGGRILFGANLHGGGTGEALFAVGEAGPVAVLRVGVRVPGGGRIVDLFPDSVDALTRPGAGPGGAALQAALGGTAANAGVFFLTGSHLRTILRAGIRTPRGGVYSAFGTPAVMQGGVAFVAKMRGGRADTAVFVAGTRPARAVAVAGKGTGTRLVGEFRSFDPPTARKKNVAFRASLSQAGVEGIFLVSGRTMVALAGSGDTAPDEGRLRSFGPPTFAGGAVVFSADVSDGSSGFYRVVAGDALANPQAVPELESLTLVGQPSPLGGAFLAFGVPSGNAGGSLAFTADLVAAQSTVGVFLQTEAGPGVP